MSTNTYQVEFFAFCPLNGIRVKYSLEVETSASAPPVMVEELIDCVTMMDSGLHEEIADQLAREFGGRQTLSAFHHGVHIVTRRGAI